MYIVCAAIHAATRNAHVQVVPRAAIAAGTALLRALHKCTTFLTPVEPSACTGLGIHPGLVCLTLMRSAISDPLLLEYPLPIDTVYLLSNTIDIERSYNIYGNTYCVCSHSSSFADQLLLECIA